MTSIETEAAIVAMPTAEQRILFVGPPSFSENSWKTRVNYILPDLFSSIPSELASLSLLTGPVPEFARDSLAQLCARFSIRHIEADAPNGITNANENWLGLIESAARQTNADIITNSLGSLRLGNAIGEAAKMVGARSVLRIAGDEIGSRLAMGVYEEHSPRHRREKKLESAGFSAVDRIIAMSPWESARISAEIDPAERDKVEICIRGVDLLRFRPTTPRPIKRLLYVGRRSAEKGYDIIEAAAELIQGSHPDIEFVFVGDFEKQQIANRNYLGWVESCNLPALYASVDAFVLTSRSEGFPQVVAEAMASGLPSILSRHLFEPIFEDGEDALLSDLDAESVAREIRRLTSDPELASRLAVRSREIAESRLDQIRWQQRYLELLLGDEQAEPAISLAPQAIHAASGPRIAFITPRVFGMLGTQGSHGLAEAFSDLTPTLVISRKGEPGSNLPIVAGLRKLPNHHLVNFAASDAGENILTLLRDFRADVVHFVNDHSWVRLIPYLQSNYPAKYVLDLKTPLMAEGERRYKLHVDGAKHYGRLDLVAALSRDIADSWVPDFPGPLLTYPLGISINTITRRTGPVPKDVSAVRFIYIGQTHPKRKLLQLLEFMARLEPQCQSRLHLDIYGAGEGNAEIDAAIGGLGLGALVTRKAPLPQAALFAKLPDYDCGIAWVPNEVFGEAPSLKFLEYAAAGLSILATDTPAHRRNLDAGFHAELFEENFSAFREALLTILDGRGEPSAMQTNFELAARHDLGWLAEHAFLPEYRKLLSEPLPLPGSEDRGEKLRLLFVTPRPLGLIATPGTYLSVEAYAEHCEIAVIAKPRTSDDEIIVHAPRSTFPIVLMDPQEEDYLSLVSNFALDFNPDIICLASWPKWDILASELRQVLPDSFMALEVKSPVVTSNKTRLAKDRARWQKQQMLLDAFIAPAEGMILTYLESLERPVLQHRSIIDYAGIAKKNAPREAHACRRFVFSGSLSEHRQLDKLVRLIGCLPEPIRQVVSFDFYGEGPARHSLEELAKTLNLSTIVRFMGVIPQSELYRLYRDYDAGIAWVPTALYDSAPSLKLIEYCAAGIAPVATSSSGHLLMREYGFSVRYFEEADTVGFTRLIEEICVNGVPTHELNGNIEKAEDFDYRTVIGEQILPFYRKVSGQKQQEQATLPLKHSGRPVQNTAHWTPALPQFHSSRADCKDLTVLGLLSERLYYGLRYECRLELLEQTGWAEALKNTKADFLLVESCLLSAHEDWHFGIGPEPSAALLDMLKAAKGRGVPTVFWLTCDVAYHDLYMAAARHFDLICAADPRMKEKLVAGGLRIVDLPPAIQPRLFNPLKPLGSVNLDFSKSLIAGIDSFESFSGIRQLVENQKAHGFTAFERTHVPTTNHLIKTSRLISNLSSRGKVSYRYLPELLKHSRALVTHAGMRITSLEAWWQALENSACMCRTLCLNEDGASSMRNSHTEYFSNASALGKALSDSEHDLGSMADSLRRWRTAFAHDTYAQRLQTISAELGIKTSQISDFRASIVTPTKRPDRINQILANYKCQAYPNKELVIVVNEDESAYRNIREAVSSIPDITVAFMPCDQFAASTLNLGVKLCTGDYFFRFDDDDYYGPDYISDMMLMLKAEDADFIGKHGAFVKVEGNSAVHQRRNVQIEGNMRTYAAADFANEAAAISGATFCVKLDLLRQHPFPDESLTTADSALLERLRTEAPSTKVIKLDSFGYTIGRSPDLASHTWRVNLNTLIDPDATVPEDLSEVPR